MTVIDGELLTPATITLERKRARSAFAVQCRVIGTLILRDFRTRIVGHKFGFVMAIFEPMAFIFVISVAMSFITKQPRIGDSFILFFATGVIPFSAFRRGSRAVKQAQKKYKKCLYLPIVQPIDPLVAVMIVEMLLYMGVYFTFFMGHFIVFGDGFPHDWGLTFMPIVVNSLLGLAVGLINAAIGCYFPPWDKFYSILTMPLMLASGVIHIVDELPTPVTNVLYYNPLAHSIVASRNGFFDTYESSFFDPYYYIGSTIALLFIGIVAERYARHRILASI